MKNYFFTDEESKYLQKILAKENDKLSNKIIKKLNRKKIKIRSCKNKGLNFQKKIASDIADMIGIRFEKDGEIDVRNMGQSGTDIILRGNAIKLFPFSVECKNTRRFAYSFIEQAMANKKENTDWLLVWKYNNNIYTIVDWEVFKKIYKMGLVYAKNN